MCMRYYVFLSDERLTILKNCFKLRTCIQYLFLGGRISRIPKLVQAIITGAKHCCIAILQREYIDRCEPRIITSLLFSYRVS